MTALNAYHRLLQTPLGTLRLVSDGSAINAIEFEDQHAGQDRTLATTDNAPPLLERAARQLDEYFQGKRRHFDLPLRAGGTAFQHSVWQALQDIPYGEVRSYRDIAISLGNQRQSGRWVPPTGAIRFPSSCPVTGSSAAMGVSRVLPGGWRRKKCCWNWRERSSGRLPWRTNRGMAVYREAAASVAIHCASLIKPLPQLSHCGARPRSTICSTLRPCARAAVTSSRVLRIMAR